MIKHKDSHLDHNLTEAQVNFILERFADRAGFFIETVELPADLGTVPCGLFGPVMGDMPVVEGAGDVYYRKRGVRAYESRLVDRDPRPTNKLTVIAGPHDGHDCVLFTAFGGPVSPKEPGDIKAQIEQVRHDPTLDELPKAQKLAALEQNLIDSMAFWREHALSGLS